MGTGEQQAGRRGKRRRNRRMRKLPFPLLLKHYLIQEASEGPDIRLEVVPILVDSLRGHVIWGAN